MTADDVLAYLAAMPKRDRPIAARTDAAMLRAWLALRSDKSFRDDILCRHGLHSCYAIVPDEHEHAIANAWSHVVQALALNPFLRCEKCTIGEYRSKPMASWQNRWKCDLCGHCVSK